MDRKSMLASYAFNEITPCRYIIIIRLQWYNKVINTYTVVCVCVCVCVGIGGDRGEA